MTWQVSEDEITFLTRGDDPYDDNVVLKKLFHPNLKLFLVSEGAQGCRYYTKVLFLFYLMGLIGFITILKCVVMILSNLRVEYLE